MDIPEREDLPLALVPRADVLPHVPVQTGDVGDGVHDGATEVHGEVVAQLEASRVVVRHRDTLLGFRAVLGWRDGHDRSQVVKSAAGRAGGASRHRGRLLRVRCREGNAGPRRRGEQEQAEWRSA